MGAKKWPISKDGLSPYIYIERERGREKLINSNA